MREKSLRAKREVFSFFFFSLIMCFLFISIAHAEEVGKITALQGKVDILRAGKSPAVPAKINEPVYLNDIIRTKTDSRAEITFRDGTVVKIAPRSRVDISEYFVDGETLKVTLNVPRGKVGAAVAEKSIEKIKASPKANRFEIKTPIAVAGVRGTNYIVAHYPTYSTVTVITGRVYTYNIQRPEIVVEVKAGESTIVREGAPPSPPRATTPKEIEREQRDITVAKEEMSPAGKEETRTASDEKASSAETMPVAVEATAVLERKPFATQLVGKTVTETLVEATPPITETIPSTTEFLMDVSFQSIEPISASDPNIKLNYTVSANRNINVKYRVIQGGSYGDWITVNTVAQNPVYFSVPVMGYGYSSYQVEIEANDESGNTKKWFSSIINPLSKYLTGTIVTNASSSVTGYAAGATGFDKGMLKLTVANPVSFSSTFNAGGGDSSTGCWILKGTASSSYFRLLTPDYLFTGSGPSSITLESGSIKSLTTAPWIYVKPLNLSAQITGYIHHYDGSKIDELSGLPQSTIFIGRTGQLNLPSNINDSVPYTTENYTVGYVPSHDIPEPTMLWGSFQQNSGSSLKLQGFAGGSWEQDYAIYGLYIGSDNSAGIIKGLKGGYNFYDEGLHIFDSEPVITLKKKADGYSAMNTWRNYIEGYYQGFFRGGSGTPTISRQDINATSYGAIGSASLSLKKGSYIEPWGVFGIELGGSHSATSPTGFTLEFGGDSWDNRDADPDKPDYWVGSISDATVSGNRMSGTFTGRFMTPNHYGTVEGKLFGDFGSDKWVGVVLGSYEPVMELSHISNIVSGTDTSKIYKQNFSPTQARINAYLGGDSFWSKGYGSIYSVGKIVDDSNEIDFSTDKGYLWYAPITWSLGSNQYSGYIGGRFAKKSDTTYNMSAYLAGIYNDSTNKGIFIGNLSTDGSSNVLTLEKRFFLEGENTVRAVTIDTGSIPSTPSPAVISNLSADSNEYGITINIYNQEAKIVMDTNTNEYNFGAGIIGMGGTYSSAPSGLWNITYTGSFEGQPNTFGALIKGDLWGSENSIQNLIHGKTYAYFADITGTPAVTGIFVGETVGTFDPTSWQAITVGVAFETQKFLSMACPGGTCNTSGTGFTEDQEKLRKLGIPVVEVGKASFSGSGNNLTVNMNDVVFFSTQTGQKPLLWSTANVTGTYSGTPTLNQSVTLNATSGASGSVQFTPTYWSGGAWAATVANDTAYPVQLSGGSYTGSVNMQGAAAGTYGSGSFSGTASGIVR
ncbi:FecR family protein [Thermodesulfovibrio sp. 3907-1M]|uniref:FecR family protein n=1 Tax=Thermodesulfovibrio autotrophicus TaxID=3118333 RepID=A0AAU8GXC3_9BACT